MSEAPLLRPGITVVVRTIGRTTLAAALASVAAQRRGDVEVVLVDALGAGTARLHAACGVPDEAALQSLVGGPVRCVSRGRALHRTESAQAGLDAAGTRFALFLDDDDVFLPGHLDALADALTGAPPGLPAGAPATPTEAAPVAAYTGVELVAPEAPSQRRGVFDQPFEPWELLLGNRVPIHAVMFDLARAREAGVTFDRGLDVYEDWDFWLQLSMLGRFVHVPGISARYHVHAEASQVHQLRHGDEPFWRVWRKWWSRAPQAWWNEALRQREVVVGLGGELAAERARGEQLARNVADRESRWREAVDQWQLTITTLRATEQQLRERSESLRRTEEALGAERHARAELERHLAEVTAHEARLAAALADAQGLVGELRRLHAGVDVQRRRLLDEAARQRQSLSWRVTGPLRVAEGGVQGLRRRAGDWRRRAGWTPGSGDYRRWIDEVESAQRAGRHAAVAPLLASALPQVSVLMPVFEPDRRWLDEAIESLQAQTWPHWELCIADDGSTQAGLREHLAAWCARELRLRVVHRTSNGGIAAATNAALALAGGDWVALLDQDDRLAPQALAELALAVHAHAALELVFSDEDKLDAHGRRCEPHRKDSFSVERLRGQNAVNHLAAFRRARLLALGGWRDGFDGAQDHELLLRFTEGLEPAQVHHIPQVLYHWRMAPGSTAASSANKARALQASLKAVNASLARVEPGAAAEGLPLRHWLRVRYPVPQPRPVVRGFDAHAGDDAPCVLVLRRGAQPIGDDGFDELLSLVTRPGVAMVGGVLVDAAGEWLDAAREAEGGGAWPLIPSAFGRREMVQPAPVVPAGFVMLTRAAHQLWLQAGMDADADTARMAAFCERVRAELGRVLWTPFALARVG